ncbi:unnamed protein product, partial [Ilex paraguariensis]
MNSPKQLALLTGVLLSFAGMEMSAVHARDVKNPQKTIPEPFYFGPHHHDPFSFRNFSHCDCDSSKRDPPHFWRDGSDLFFLKSYHLGWAVPIIAVLIAFGAMGGVSTWAAGPSKGLLAAARNGDLPPFFT